MVVVGGARQQSDGKSGKRAILLFQVSLGSANHALRVETDEDPMQIIHRKTMKASFHS